MIWGGGNEMAFVLLALGVVLLIAWAGVRRFAPRALREVLHPIFVGLACGVALAIVYLMSGPATALVLALPVAIIAYFSLSGRSRRLRRDRPSERAIEEPEPPRRRRA